MGQGTILGIVPLLHFANHDMNDKKFYEMKKLHGMKKLVSLILASSWRWVSKVITLDDLFAW